MNEKVFALSKYGGKVLDIVKERIVEGRLELDAESLADMAVELRVRYDPDKHRGVDHIDIEPGDIGGSRRMPRDSVFILSDAARAADAILVQSEQYAGDAWKAFVANVIAELTQELEESDNGG